jgi:uncharacterized membrane protein YczE
MLSAPESLAGSAVRAGGGPVGIGTVLYAVGTGPLVSTDSPARHPADRHVPIAVT